MSDISLRIDGLGKQYRIGGKQEKYRTLRDTIADAASAPFRRAGQLLQGQAYGAAGLKEEIWALKDVSFEVKRGEVIGIIGRNGAGKSTLLKILSRITEPTTGYVEIYGRVGALLEVGTGFHPELTGRENVYLNGAILGMSRAEIDRKFDEMVAFAEIEKFIDTPVKYYSSGMGLRLGFAVAAHLEPEILIVDEVLAVGDAAFQRKCLGKMDDVAKTGRTVLFVSHNMAAVASLCSKGMVIHKGQLVKIDTTQAAIGHYLGSMSDVARVPLYEISDRKGNQHLRFTHMHLLNSYGSMVDTVEAGDDITIELRYEIQGAPLSNVVFQISFLDKMDQILFVCLTRTVNQNFEHVTGGSVVRCIIPNLPLSPDTYRLTISCKEQSTIQVDRIEHAMTLTVTSGNFFGTGKVTPPDCGPFMVRHRWELDQSGEETL